ncbi:hypothetical protein NTE_01271 [Candidatus Nitrososphaera evergladensis SR1]|jgi:hypothetical protein|uniref:Uncharacterized protein n=2 Tax=Nitrososphaera TaxID=497726 RepID=A0A075MQI5_9ARCH|nr:hypothetical protein NTE_01271 [Candidatus Nitrososphaera evergladensis SR1]
MWDINGLIDKLLEVHAVEKQQKGVTFTVSFRRFLVCSLRGNQTKAETLEGWRFILADYHYSLVTLSAEEIGATVVLLDYYFQHLKAAAPDGR